MINKEIDGGREFDWGLTSDDYARFRDIYPEILFERLYALGIGTKGQKLLDLGTGAGNIPRKMYRFGADITGADISENQIAAAKRLSEKDGMNIKYIVSGAEELPFGDNSFDAITACQCAHYFKHDVTAPLFHRILISGGKLVFMCMNWLPYEDKTAGMSEELILKYNPAWTGGGETRHEYFIPECYNAYFRKAHSEVFDVNVPFTRELWNGRIKACRGIGASLSAEETARFEAEHLKALEELVPESFEVLHYCAITVLEKI